MHSRRRRAWRGDRAAAATLYEWSAEELGESRLLELVRDGNTIYAWRFEQRHVWRTPHMPLAARVLQRVTRAR